MFLDLSNLLFTVLLIRCSIYLSLPFCFSLLSYFFTWKRWKNNIFCFLHSNSWPSVFSSKWLHVFQMFCHTIIGPDFPLRAPQSEQKHMVCFFHLNKQILREGSSQRRQFCSCFLCRNPSWHSVNTVLMAESVSESFKLEYLAWDESERSENLGNAG